MKNPIRILCSQKTFRSLRICAELLLSFLLTSKSNTIADKIGYPKISRNSSWSWKISSQPTFSLWANSYLSYLNSRALKNLFRTSIVKNWILRQAKEELHKSSWAKSINLETYPISKTICYEKKFLFDNCITLSSTKVEFYPSLQ